MSTETTMSIAFILFFVAVTFLIFGCGLGLTLARTRASNPSTTASLSHEIHGLMKRLRETECQLMQMNYVVCQAGEMLDHIGVDIEHTQDGRDLMWIGNTLRRFWGEQHRLDVLRYKSEIMDLGARYGVNDCGHGDDHLLRYAVRIAEEIINRQVHESGFRPDAKLVVAT